MNTWHRAGRWVAAALLLAVAPVPVVVGRLLLADRGATPATAAAVTVGVTTTILCLLGCASVVRLAYRPAPPPEHPWDCASDRPSTRASRPARRRRPARHTAGDRRPRRLANQRRAVGAENDL